MDECLVLLSNRANEKTKVRVALGARIGETQKSESIYIKRPCLNFLKEVPNLCFPSYKASYA